ncbi:triokinase/FMN cyclase [Petromyzon marinus]|uniref:triokinase/FMN cyclase n=1 Tax=Petromyzon marinus TaxID=7757 RepID=UPI003F72095B
MDLEKSKQQQQQQQQQHQQQMLLNSTESCVLESLRGFVGFHPTLRLLPGPHRIVLRWESVTRVGTSPEIGQEAGRRTGQKTVQGTSQCIGQGASQGIDQETRQETYQTTSQETGQVTNQETGQGTSQETGQGTSQETDLGTSHKNGRVAVISGGGAGHEPAHAGFVGVGMLSAAVSGHVFASPAPSAVLAAVRALAHSGAMGVLLVVKNYAGDRLNFGVAAERARAEGVEVEMVVVADDCATPAIQSDSEDEDDDGVHDDSIDTDSELETDSEPHPEPDVNFDSTAIPYVCSEHDRDPSDRRRGNRRSRRLHRRGLCGTLLVHKVAGALAEQGRPLSEVAREARAAARATVTLAVGLSSCQVPGLALRRWSTPLQAGEMDLGVGIHGEAGAERVALAPARDVVRIMLGRMVGDGDSGGDNGDGGFAGGGNGSGTVGGYVGVCASGIGNVCGVDGVGDVAGGFGDYDYGRSDDSTGYHGTQRIIEWDSDTSSAVSRSSGTGLRVAGDAKLSDASGGHAGPPSTRPVGCSAQGRLPLRRGEHVALMVNNLGGTSHLELGVIAREAAEQLGVRGVVVERSYVGTFMTALAMAGVSLTVMRLDHEGIRLHCLDADTNAPSWPRASWTSSSLLSLSSAGRAYGDTCGGGYGGGQYVVEELEEGDALDEGRGQQKDQEKGHQQQEGRRQQDCQQKEHQQKKTVWDYHQEVGHEQGKSRRWAIEKMDEEADQGDSADRPEPPRPGHEARVLHGGQRGGEDDSDPGAPVRAAMTEVCEALLALESELNDLDSGSGDGDCGTSHARGARASLHWLRHLRADPRTASATVPGHLLRGLSELLEEDMGGTSGALYSLMLSAAAGALGSAPRPCPADWARAFAAAVRAVRRHGGARPGDRTMLDPLWAAHLELRVLLAGPTVGRRGFPMDGACGAEAADAKESSGQEEEKEEVHVLNAIEVLARAVDRATAQALATAQMGARAGRAGWARAGEAWGRVDPGARAVEVALRAVSFSLQAQGHW